MSTKEFYLVVFNSKLFEREFNFITVSVLRTESDKSSEQYSFVALRYLSLVVTCFPIMNSEILHFASNQ